MAFYLTLDQTGQIAQGARLGKMISTETLAAITAAGYLDNANLNPNTIAPTDWIFCAYGLTSVANGIPSGAPVGFALLTPTITAGVITLNVTESAVITPTIVNHIATYADTKGTITEDAATAINGGNIQAGLSGTAGTLASFPGTAAKGSFVFKATANTGNTVTTFTNAAMGQATVLTTPDPVSATANVVIAPAALVSGNLVKASGIAGLVVDATFKISAGVTNSYAGGGTTNTFSATGLTVASHGSAVIRTSTNSVAITKALPGTDTLAITFSADPGAGTTVDYVYSSAVVI